MTPARTPQHALEVLKLLLQVAWADDRVVRAETDRVLRLAHRLGLDDPTIEQIESWLAGERPLPAPDLGLLRAHRGETLTLARELAAADEVVSGDEDVVLGELERLLGGG